MTIINPSTSLVPVTDAPVSSGNAQLAMMEILGNAFKIGKKDQDAQPSPMIAYVEEAYAEATANLSFEARQDYWKRLASNMKGMPNQLQAFIEGQNNLFNHNPALEKLQKELQDLQNQCKNDQHSKEESELVAKIAFATAGALVVAAAIAACIPVVGPFIAAGLLIAAGIAAAVGVAAEIASGVYSGKISKEEGEINWDKGAIASLESTIENESMTFAQKLNSSAEKVISDNQITAEALIGALKTQTSVAKSVSHNAA